MKRVLFLALLAVILFSLPVYAADTLAFTAEVTVPNNSFVYKGSTEDFVIPESENARLGTAYADEKLGYGSLGGHIAAACFMADVKALVLVTGSTVDSLKIISMPTTPKDATVVYSVATTFKTTYADLVKLSATKYVLVYKTADSATTMYAQTITVNSGITTATLSTGNPAITIVSQTVNPVVSRVSATKAVIRYIDASDTISRVYNTASDTVETATMAIEGTTSVLASDKYSADFLIFTKILGVPTIVTETNADTTSMAPGYVVDMPFLESTVEVGDVAQMDATHAVFVYREGTNTYMQATDFTTEDTGAAILIGTTSAGDNFAVDKMLAKLDSTHVAVTVNGKTKIYTLNLTSHVLTLFGTDTYETDDTYRANIYETYSDTVVTNPTIFKTHWDRPNSHLRKISYINYESAARVGFVATGVATNATCSVQLNGVITKSNSLTSGVDLYVNNAGTLTESSAGCADQNPIGVKLRGTSILLQ